MSRRRQFFSTTAVNLSIALGTGAGGIVLARGLGPEDRGAYALLFTWFLIVQSAAEGGLFGAAVYFVSRTHSNAMLSLRRRLGRLTLLHGIIVGALLALLVQLLSLAEGLARGFLIGALGLPLLLLSGVWSFTLYGMSIKKWNMTRGVQVPLYIGGLAVLSAWGTLTLESAFLTYLGSVYLAGLAARMFLGSPAFQHATSGGSAPTTGQLYVYAIPSGAWSFLTLLNRRLDILVLGMFTSDVDIGYYAVAVTFMSFVSPAIAAAGNLALPQLSRSVAEGRSTKEYRRVTLRWAIIGGAAVAGTAALLTYPATLALLGRQFEAAIPLAVLLAPAAWAAAVKQVAADMLRGLGVPRTAAIVEMVLLPVTLASAAVGAAIAGSLGTATGISLSSCMAAGLLCWRAWRHPDALPTSARAT